MRKLYKFIFKQLGWKVAGRLPVNHKKYVLVVAPHTSNWDFFVGLGARATFNFWPQYAAKSDLFFWPLGWILKRLGGYPVVRSKNTNFVQSFADIFKKEKEFILTITPEGTRSYNPDWKTGFYYIAKEANVPIVPVAFDYKTKTVTMREPMNTDMSVEETIDELKKWYSHFQGKNPQNGVHYDN
ncbi:MAG: 1-acyl-sn-glycerol-3-phosphate acyltransferase [Flavobacteriales bacterium]|nr:1-acyl-sn-glycerol-3-phosphate acyltransferase [Flavobacteriales bacterium]